MKDSVGKYYNVNLPDKYKNCMGRTQVTESLIAQILTMHFHYGMTLGEVEEWLKAMGLNFAHSTVMNWIENSADILEPLDKPLQKEITTNSDVHGDETTVKGKDKRLAFMSVFANIRNYKLDPVKYLCDVFRRIKNTADDKLVELLAHKWQPSTVSEWV